jgi:hypothetical protein
MVVWGTAKGDETLVVAWGPTGEVAKQRVIMNCKRVSRSCNPEAVPYTDDLDNAFVLT